MPKAIIMMSLLIIPIIIMISALSSVELLSCCGPSALDKQQQQRPKGGLIEYLGYCWLCWPGPGPRIRLNMSRVKYENQIKSLAACTVPQTMARIAHFPPVPGSPSCLLSTWHLVRFAPAIFTKCQCKMFKLQCRRALSPYKRQVNTG